jgi:hypothetical protein
MDQQILDQIIEEACRQIQDREEWFSCCAIVNAWNEIDFQPEAQFRKNAFRIRYAELFGSHGFWNAPNDYPPTRNDSLRADRMSALRFMKHAKIQWPMIKE